MSYKRESQTITSDKVRFESTNTNIEAGVFRAVNVSPKMVTVSAKRLGKGNGISVYLSGKSGSIASQVKHRKLVLEVASDGKPLRRV